MSEVSTNPILSPAEPPGRMTARMPSGLPVIVAAVIFAMLSLTAAITSEGFLEADACTHYQYARFALGEPHYFVNVWGRPFVTALYAIPATLCGRMGVRVTSLCCAMLIALMAWQIARDQKYRWPALAFIFTLAQPLMFLHSFSELTELPFAVLLVAAFWAYRREQWLIMAALIALTPTARPEGFGLLLLAFVALIAHRRWWWTLVLPIPVILWTYAGWRIYGQPVYDDSLSLRLPENFRWLMWLRHEWPYAQKSAYASGYLLHFVALLPAIVSPTVFPFFLVGVWRSVVGSDGGEKSGDQASKRRSDEGSATSSSFPSSLCRYVAAALSNPLYRAQLLIVILPLGILTAHGLLYWLGRMASNGELRYMLIVSPFWALLAAKGWEWTFTRYNWRHPFAWAGVIAVLPMAVNFYDARIPIRLTYDSYKARAVAKWYKDGPTHIDYPRIMASNPEVAYFMGVSHTDRGWLRDWRKGIVDKTPPGTVLVWDPIYGLFNADADRVIPLEEIKAAGWIEQPQVAEEINQFGPDPTGVHDWRVFFSPRQIVGDEEK